MAHARLPLCPPLPLEIWGEILAYVKDLDLWIICHRISRKLRSEAEREFVTKRLARMRISAMLRKS